MVASGSCNGVVLLTSLVNGRLLSMGTKNRHDESVTALAFNHDGSLLISCARSQVMYLWKVVVPDAADVTDPSKEPSCLEFLHQFWNAQDAAVITACTVPQDSKSNWRHWAVTGSQVGNAVACTFLIMPARHVGRAAQPVTITGWLFETCVSFHCDRLVRTCSVDE